MQFLTVVLLLLLLIAITAANPLLDSTSTVVSTAYTPSPTFPNGTANELYPCGTTDTEIAVCPYRCYSSAGMLHPQCYTAKTAKTAIATLHSICVKCVLPNVPEDTSTSCQPLGTYFSGIQNPSPCGFEKHRVRTCAWVCGEAQVPFDVCSATNTTGEFSLCEECVPQCSSPRVVFEPPALPTRFSLSAGNCSTVYGPQERVACPWRCRGAGRPAGDSFCSLTDKTDGEFTACTAC